MCSAGRYRKAIVLVMINQRPLAKMVTFWLTAFVLFLSVGAPANEKSPLLSPDDLTELFKKTISSPKEVEHFVGTQKTLREPSSTGAPNQSVVKIYAPRTFEGARSGSNFYLRSRAKGTNAIAREWNPLVVGRVGINSYQMNQNTLTLTDELPESSPTNPISVFAKSFRMIVNQFLNQGLGDVKSGSVVWTNNEFSGVLDSGESIFGGLYLSNGLPSRLEVRRTKNGSPYKVIAYEYPRLPGSLSGFPSRSTISTLSGGKLHPDCELTLLEVQLASHPMPEDMFNAARLVRTNILYTNEYVNGARYSVQAGGQRKRLRVNQLNASSQPPKNIRKLTVVIVSAAVIGFVLIFLNLALNRQTESQRK